MGGCATRWRLGAAAIAAVLALPGGCGWGQVDPSRTVAADYAKVKGPKSQVWRECIGAGRAAEGLRAAWQEQLKTVQAEIGFKSIRFHGLLTDDMGVYGEFKDGRPRHNWQYVDQLYDALLANHIRPFVEIGFMPNALASGTKTVFWWKANVTPPKDYDKWDDLITSLTEHWTERYGAEEVKQWNFEVWNEADYPAFFGPKDPKNARGEYFELYAHTAAAIKKVNAAYRVGGPASSNVSWVKPFIENAEKEKLPLDFVSFHAYGLGNGPGGLDETGSDFHYMGTNMHQVAETVLGQRPVIDASPRPNLPIHLTEWSASYSSRDPVHDAYFSAPYILDTLKRTERGVASLSYWVFTDIFEENGPGMMPFHGGFGLINEQGIRKPSFYAFQFMNKLGETELEDADEASWVCKDGKGGVQVMLWDLTGPPTTEKVPNENYFRQVVPPKEKGSVKVSLTHVPAGEYDVTLTEVGFEKNDAYTAWLKMDKPAQLTRGQERQLRDASAGKPEVVKEVTVGADGKFEETQPLRENDVLLVTLTKR